MRLPWVQHSGPGGHYKTHRGWHGHTVWKVQYLLMRFVPDILLWIRFILHLPHTVLLFTHINKSLHEFRNVPFGSHCKKRRSVWNARLRTESRILSEIAKYVDIKNWLCQERRNHLGTELNPERTSKIVFLGQILRLASNSRLLQIDDTDDLSSLRKTCEYLFRRRTA